MTAYRTLLACLLITATVMAPITAFSSCPEVDHTNYVSGGWEYDEFYELGTPTPLTVELTISDIKQGTTIQYHNGLSWMTIAANCTVDGSKTRFSEGGSVTISYVYGDCGEEIQTSDM